MSNTDKKRENGKLKVFVDVRVLIAWIPSMMYETLNAIQKHKYEEAAVETSSQ